LFTNQASGGWNINWWEIVSSGGTPPPNQLPAANAGADQTVTLPASTATLTGSGSDPDGTITGYAWTRVTGPKTATIATQSRMLKAGQACICAKRFIVTEKVADEFATLFANKIIALQQGNPLQSGIDMGPLARIDLAEKLSYQLENSLKQGARLIVGGERDHCNF